MLHGHARDDRGTESEHAYAWEDRGFGGDCVYRLTRHLIDHRTNVLRRERRCGGEFARESRKQPTLPVSQLEHIVLRELPFAEHRQPVQIHRWPDRLHEIAGERRTIGAELARQVWVEPVEAG